MPTSYTDQFYTFDPASPPPGGTAVTAVSLGMVDQDDDGDIGAAGGDTVAGSDVVNSWPGDTVTINVPGTGNVTYTGTTFYTADGGRYFTPTDGQVLEDGTFVGASFVTTQAPLDVGDLGPPCFVTGTLIETETGARPVESLTVGDRVVTRDHGLQEILWTGARHVPGVRDFAPIRFSDGAIGNARPLLVSPQHRVLFQGWRAELLFGNPEVLIAAKHLINGETIHRAPCAEVGYHHLLFAEHELVLSEGCWTESFFPGSDFVRADHAVRSELTTLFPELFTQAEEDGFATILPTLKGFEARVLMVQ